MFTQSEVIKNLKGIFKLLRENNIEAAKKSFLKIKDFVDSKEHLSMPDKKLRFLVWELYEFLILDNKGFADRDSIVQSYRDFFED